MIIARVKAGMDRARISPRKGENAIGRSKVAAATEEAIRERLAAGACMLKIARELNVDSGTVQRVRRSHTLSYRCSRLERIHAEKIL